MKRDMKVKVGETIYKIKNADIETKVKVQNLPRRLSSIEVIKSFQKDEKLYRDIPDIVEMMEIFLIIRTTQAGTERDVNHLKEITDGRFNGRYNEEYQERYPNAKDRVLEELFLDRLQIPLHCLPLQKCRKEWRKRHRAATLRSEKLSSTIQTLRNETPKFQFLSTED